ncbi:hypothetical protein BT96DRAFT_990208 [Gymnopus androsaceus JB14]|uniref:G-protein coupled receptors family 1 profile domain-containing protein n=1 Tax=Gymnopus androsaceus JB14 TaxID=1447944 RepID=A0A6A4I317_9AGAR|nr:hypothetical protein BT96DRAFT_990208 [Gymnopus androsaceus JB14]
MEHTLQITPSETIVGATGPYTSSIVDLATIKIFIAFQMFGGIGMLILLSSASLSRTKTVQQLLFKGASTSNFSIGPINRSRTWYSFCISWIISCFSYCLLFFAREQFNQNEEPTYGVCMIQAALIYSSSPLTGATSFALFLDVWWMLHASMLGKKFGGSALMTTLLVAPYAFWVILTIGFLVAGGANPQTVQRDLAVDPYCVLSHPVPSLIVCSLTLVFGLAVLVMLLILAVDMHRMRIQNSFNSSRSKFELRTAGDHENDNRSGYGRTRAQMLALIVRLITFGVLGVIVVSISTVFVFNRATGMGPDLMFAVADLTMAGLPSAGVVIFGTQMDFLQLWFCLIQWPLRWLATLLHRGIHSSNDATSNSASPRSHSKGTTDSFDAESVEMENQIVLEVLEIGRGHLVVSRDEEVLVSPRRVETEMVAPR